MSTETVTPISEKEFSSNPVGHGHPNIHEEKEWYKLGPNILGTIILDKVDSDWSFVVLVRGRVGFHCIASKPDHASIVDARSAMTSAMLKTGNEVETTSLKAVVKKAEAREKLLLDVMTGKIPPPANFDEI